MPKADITGATASQASSTQDVDRLAFATLRNKWNDYPKTYACVSAKCAEIRLRQQTSSALAAMSLNVRQSLIDENPESVLTKANRSNNYSGLGSERTIVVGYDCESGSGTAFVLA